MKLVGPTMLLLVLIVSCQTKASKINDTTSFYVGTYTDGESQGIYKYNLQKDGKLQRVGLVAKSSNPSFLTKSYDGNYLIAVNEINNKDSVGLVESYKITKDSLQLINRSSSGGAHPCYLTTNKEGYVLVSNYTGGNIGLLKLNTEGKLSGLLDIEQHVGSASNERQKKPHAHSAQFASNNTIISADLGTNELWFSKLDTLSQKFNFLNPNTLKMEPIAGPRHFALHPNGEWIYVVNELNSTITLVKKTENGTYEKGSSISTLPADFKEINFCADIHLTWGGKFVYASNRGHDSIAIYKVNENDGSLTLIGTESTQGKAPRNFSLSPDENFVVVANQNTNSIISFKRDATTGLLDFVDKIEAPKPVCITF